MIKLLKFLKPFVAGLLLTVSLLFAQALCDLNLPDYMSDIVNTGIQQSGIEHAAPEAVSKNGMNLITSFMDDGEKKLIAENYILTDTGAKNTDGKTYGSLYPNAGSQIYVKIKTDKETSERLDNAFGRSVWTFINLMKNTMPQNGQSEADIADIKDIDITDLYRIQPLFENMPPETITEAHKKASANDPALLRQSGIMFARALYNELGADLNAIQTGYIIKTGLYMISVALLGGLAAVAVSFLSSIISVGVARDMRRKVFEKIESFSNNEFDKFSAASLITRCTNDVTQIQQLILMGIRMLCYAPIMGIGGVIMALRKTASMSWIIALAVTVILGLIIVIMSIAIPKFKSIQKLVDKLNLVSRENLSGMMVIRAFGTEKCELKRFDSANRDFTKTSLFVNRIMVFMMPAMMLIMNTLILLIVWTGSHEIADTAMRVGDMMAFMQYTMQVLMSFIMVSIMFIMVPRAAVSADRISEVLETELSIQDPEKPGRFLPEKKGYVEFKNVSFRYNGAEEDALRDITFTAVPGQTTAIIGPTGSGKSTICSLALRFYDVTQGSILVDGADIRSVRQKDLRAIISYVPQKGILLSGTIASNIKYGKKDASEEEVEAAASVAQAAGFIADKPERFGSEIAQGGTNVSGGQKQRLSIARAIAKKPEIFIFDDSFSALDLKTDAALRKSLKKHTGDSTVIIVAQRVSSIMNAEQIIVLDRGRIVGRGTHSELLETCPEYYEIASSQLSGGETA